MVNITTDKMLEKCKIPFLTELEKKITCFWLCTIVEILTYLYLWGYKKKSDYYYLETKPS